MRRTKEKDRSAAGHADARDEEPPAAEAPAEAPAGGQAGHRHSVLLEGDRGRQNSGS